MKTINRTVLTIIPRQPYIDWVNSIDQDGIKIDMENKQSLAILISDKYDEYNYEQLLKRNYSDIFEEELNAWIVDPNIWPEDRSYEAFNKWFEVIVSDMVIDMGIGPVDHEFF